MNNAYDNKKIEKRKVQITELVTAYYNKFDFLQHSNLNTLINRALDEFLYSDLSIEEINEKIMKLILDSKRKVLRMFDKEKVEENHKEIYSRLDTLVALLAKYDIDYQLAGALCSYLKYGEESERVHEDIDLNLNEDDLVKFKLVCKLLGYEYYDKRFDSPRVLKNGIPSGDHEIGANIPDSDLHIGVFCFNRNKDGSIDNKSYYKNEDGNNCVWVEHLSPRLSNLIFGKESIEFNGKQIFITPPEYVYSLKNYTRKLKDKKDLEFMEGRIDMDKLDEIRTINKTDRRVDLVEINNDELDNMINDSQNIDIEDTIINDEKPKTIIKNNNSNNNDNKGFIHYRQIIVPFIVLVLIVVIIEIYNFIA